MNESTFSIEPIELRFNTYNYIPKKVLKNKNPCDIFVTVTNISHKEEERMKYRNWNLLVNASLSSLMIIIGAWGIIRFPQNEILFACFFGIVAILDIALFIFAYKIRHEKYDEALKEAESEAYKQSYLIVLFILVLGSFITFFYKKPLNNLFYWIELIYGIIYLLPSLCLIRVEKKYLQEIEDGTEE